MKMKKSFKNIFFTAIVTILIVVAVVLVFFFFQRDNGLPERYTLSGEVTWIDDTNGQAHPDTGRNVLVFPLSDLEFFRNSMKVIEEYESRYIGPDGVSQSYVFENTDALGKYQFELDFGEYVICFGSKTPNETIFERFYPENCYQFEIKNLPYSSHFAKRCMMNF